MGGFKINTPAVTHETFDQETVIVNLEKGYYYSLEKVGAKIWQEIEKGATSEQIVEVIQQIYNAPFFQIEEEVLSLIQKLQQEELILPSSCYLKDFFLPVSSELSYTSPLLCKYSDMQDLLLLDPIHEVDATGWPLISQK